MTSFDAIPIVDLALAVSDKETFFRDLHHALCEVGFMVLTNAPGLDRNVQTKAFSAAHCFFNAPRSTKDRCAQVESPHYRGYNSFREGAIGLATEAYQYGPEQPALLDTALPAWKRMIQGPNQWPDLEDAKDFKQVILALHHNFGELEKQLGHLICEMLEVPAAKYEHYFEGGDYIASMNHMHAAAEFTDKERAQISRDQHGMRGGGAHVDGAPFVTLLIADQPGLEVFSPGLKKWIDVPVIPGSVVVNIGGTLQKLSSGRMIATMHRVNPLKAPHRRVSLPYFRLPRMDCPLEPFDGSTLIQRDRGLDYAYDRMKLFPEVTARWYHDEWPQVEAAWREELAARKAARSRL